MAGSSLEAAKGWMEGSKWHRVAQPEKSIVLLQRMITTVPDVRLVIMRVLEHSRPRGGGGGVVVILMLGDLSVQEYDICESIISPKMN